MRSIRARLTLWYMSLLTVTLVLLGGAAYWLLTYSLSSEMDRSLKSVATVLSERTHSGASDVFPAEVDEIFRRFFGFSPFDRYFQMVDPPGHREERHSRGRAEKLPLSSEALQNALHGIPTFETVEGLEKYPVRILTVPVIQAGHLTRLVQVGMSLQSIAETRTRFLLIMAGLLPVGVIFAGLGGWLLAHRALKPVDRMTEAAKRIGAEHLKERIHETGAGDELDRLAATLNRMFERLDTAFSQIRLFTANASHELQTPLTILKGELEVGLRSPREPREYQEILESALEEIDRINRLVEGLLLLARNEAGVLRMDLRQLDLMEILEEVYNRLKPLADMHGVGLRFGSLEPVPVQGDRQHLERLFFNLIENGIKYTKPGGHVMLSLKKGDDQAIAEVSDTGTGMTDTEREKIFQPFYRSPEALTQKGVGLGLSIAQSIASAHGGQIQVESAPGEGSTFRVLLPLGSHDRGLF